MKVCFILTPFDQLKSAGFTTNKVKKIYGYSMPLGIASLGAILEKAGHSVAALDPCPLRMSIDQIVTWAMDEKPDIIGISVMTYVAPMAYKIATALKEKLKDVPIVMGGSHCTVFPDLVLKDSSSVDVVVIGEAEDRVIPLFTALYEKRDIGGIDGLVFRDSTTGEIRQTNPPAVQADLNIYPFAARHLFNNDLYIPFPDQSRKLPVTNIMTSRGCTWRKCKFCFEGGRFMPRYRRRSPENVIEELKEIKKAGFNGMAFWDDNFLVNEKWVLKFCDLLKQSNLGMTWTCYGRADTITENMIQAIKSAGCFSIYIGFESGNQDMLDMLSKGTTLEQVVKAVRSCQKAGIEVRGSFILGLPHDTPELARQSVKFARKLNLDFVKFMLYTPEQGTELYDIAMESGTVINMDFQGSLTKATYVPKGYESAEQLEKIAIRANMGYVLRPRYILKKIMSIRGWKDLRKYIDGFIMMISLRRTKK